MHSVAAAFIATAGATLALQGVANTLWERGFYASVTPESQGLVMQGGLYLLLAIAQLAAIGCWFAGLAWSGRAVLVATVAAWFLVPVPLAAALSLSTVLVGLDLMVLAHRRG